MSNATFAMLPNWLLCRRDVPATGKLLYARLRQYQGDNSAAWPGVGTLAVQLGTDRSCIIANVRKLESLGLLKVDRRTGYRASNHYRVVIPTGSETPLVAKSDQLQNATSLVVKRDLTSSEMLPKENKKRSKEVDQSPVELPASLNVSRFVEAWKDFEEHRRQIRKKLTPLAARKQLAALEVIGVDRAVIAINHSIAAGWQSIHEPNGNGNHNNGKSGRITGEPGKYANIGTTIG